MTIQKYLVLADKAENKAKYMRGQWILAFPSKSMQELYNSAAVYYEAKAEYLRVKAHYLTLGERI